MEEALDIPKGSIIEDSEEWAQVLSGNKLFEGSKPISH